MRMLRDVDALSAATLLRCLRIACIIGALTLTACGGSSGGDDEPADEVPENDAPPATEEDDPPPQDDGEDNPPPEEEDDPPADEPPPEEDEPPTDEPPADPEPTPDPPDTPSEQGAMLWSDPATWGSAVPQAGQDVTIVAGSTVILDSNTPSLGQLQINGTLLFDERDLELSAEGIRVTGTLAIGNADQPYSNRAVITLTGGESDDPNARGLVVEDGTLLLYGQVPGVAWTTLNDHAAAGATELTLATDVAWQSGDNLVIAPTDFYGVMETERVEIASVQNNTVSLSSGLANTRWGKLQYLTESGVSETYNASVAAAVESQLPAADIPTVLDERAEVGNLSRNIVIQGSNDGDWQNNGFGAHVMVMGNNSDVWIQGVELRRVGQAGRMARYPIHFHGLNYVDGAELPVNGTRVVRYSSVWDSANRCITIHGTNEVTVDHNICYDILGHAVFLEDAVERRNVITNNLVLKVRFPDSDDRLLNSDRDGDGTGSAGFWITNPDNTVRGNHAADSRGNGFWLSFPREPLGLNKMVPIKPFRLPLREFSDNTAHSNKRVNFQLDWVPYNDDGDVTPNHYFPTSDGQEPNGSNEVRFTMSGIASWKGEGIWNRPVGATFVEWVSADNTSAYFAGSGYKGRIRRSLVVGESLNNATTWEAINASAPPTAFASYHSEYNMQDNVVVNFPIYPGPHFRANGGSQLTHGGMLATGDYYITPVDLGPVHIKNNWLINSHPGFRVRKPDAPGAHWTLAGALWDADGFWGPAENYWVYDMPFLTAGTDCQNVMPIGENGQSCAGPYYGMIELSGKNVWEGGKFLKTLDVRRLNNSGGEIDQWLVRDGRTGDGFFDIMRHVALVKNGIFQLHLADDVGGIEQPFTPSGDFFFRLTNFNRSGDSVVLGLPYTGSETAKVYVNGSHNPDSQGRLAYASDVDSLAAVQSASDNVMWQDTANNVVWLKAFAPPNYELTGDYSEMDLNTLHRGVWIRVYTCSYMDQTEGPGDPAYDSCH